MICLFVPVMIDSPLSISNNTDFHFYDLEKMSEIKISDTIYDDIAAKFTLEIEKIKDGYLSYTIKGPDEQLYNLECQLNDSSFNNLSELKGFINLNINYMYEEAGKIYAVLNVGFKTNDDIYMGMGAYIKAEISYDSDSNSMMFNNTYEILENYDVTGC